MLTDWHNEPYIISIWVVNVFVLRHARFPEILKVPHSNTNVQFSTSSPMSYHLDELNPSILFACYLEHTVSWCSLINQACYH